MSLQKEVEICVENFEGKHDLGEGGSEREQTVLPRTVSNSWYSHELKCSKQRLLFRV